MEKPTDAPQLAIIFNNASGMRYTLLESQKVAIFDEKLKIQQNMVSRNKMSIICTVNQIGP